MRSGPTRGSSSARNASGSGTSRRTHLERDHAVEGVDVDVRPLARDDAGQPQQRAPLVLLAGLEREHGRRVVRDVARRQLVEGEVVVRALERRRRRQDDVGVARRLVEVEVERDVEVERLERRLEPARVRRRARGVAGQRDQRADLAVAGRLDLLGQAGDGQLAEALRQAAHA